MISCKKKLTCKLISFLNNLLILSSRNELLFRVEYLELLQINNTEDEGKGL